MPTLSIVVTSTSTPDGTALARIRRRLAAMLGRHGVFTTTAASAIGDARRQILCSSLSSSVPGRGQFDGTYLYVVDGAQGEQNGAPGQQRQIVDGAYHGPIGSLLVDNPYTAALASGVTFELSELPAVPYLGIAVGLNTAIKEAAETLPVHVDLDLTFVTDQVRYSLTGLPFPIRDGTIVDVYPPIASGHTAAETQPRPISRGAWSFDLDGEGPYLSLRHGFTAGETFFVRVRRTAASWIKSAGTWGASTVGPVLSADEVLYDERTVATIAYPIALARLVAYHAAVGNAEQASLYDQRLAEAQRAGPLVNWFSRTRGDGVQRAGAVGYR